MRHVRKIQEFLHRLSLYVMQPLTAKELSILVRSFGIFCGSFSFLLAGLLSVGVSNGPPFPSSAHQFIFFINSLVFWLFICTLLIPISSWGFRSRRINRYIGKSLGIVGLIAIFLIPIIDWNFIVFPKEHGPGNGAAGSLAGILLLLNCVLRLHINSKYPESTLKP